MYIKTIKLENVKGFKDLKFDLTRPDGSYAGWTVLVGGNASGKSTLLKSIALSLMGADSAREFIGTTGGWISSDKRHAKAEIDIIWDPSNDAFKQGGKQPNQSFPIGVRWVYDTNESTTPIFRSIERRTPSGTRILTPDRGPWNPNANGWFSAGYGPMRRLSGSSTESMRFTLKTGIVSRFVTLFREDAALSESETWLRINHSRWLEDKTSRSDLLVLINGVKALLNDGLLPHGMNLSKLTVDNVFVKDSRNVELPMRDISDGCRSIYATILDLVHNMFEVYGASDLFSYAPDGGVHVKMPGVVLIDEIEAHLHPSWQKDVPEWLKKHFPNIQFIVTTHSPLIAQAADPNGIYILPSQDDFTREPRMLSPEEYEKIRLGRAEKTLLGVAFGLKTVRSKWANQQIEKWKRLNAKAKSGINLNASESVEYENLKNQMKLIFETDSE